MTALYLAALAPEVPADWQSVISPAEQARALSWPEPRALEFIQIRYWLRQHLAALLALPPAEIPLGITPEGKPYVIDHPYHFSISHSRGYWALALSATHPLGIDLELGPLRGSYLKVAQRFFTPAELAWLNSEPDLTFQRQLFYRIWTGKEAIVKALGLTLLPQLQHISISASGSCPAYPLQSWPCLQGCLSVVSPEPVTTYSWHAAVAAWRPLASPHSFVSIEEHPL